MIFKKLKFLFSNVFQPPRIYLRFLFSFIESRYSHIFSLNYLFNKADKILIKKPETDLEETVCEDCLKKRTEAEQIEVARLEQEAKDLEDRIKLVEQDTAIMEKKTGKNELEQMSRNKIEILKQISGFENEQENKKREINELVETVLKLELEEEKFWQEINEYEQELLQLEERKSLYDKNIHNLEVFCSFILFIISYID